MVDVLPEGFKWAGDRSQPQRIDTDEYRREVFLGNIAPDGRPALDHISLDQAERNKDILNVFEAFSGNDPNYVLLWGGLEGYVGLWGGDHGALLLWGDENPPPILPIAIRIAVSKPGRTFDIAQAAALDIAQRWYGVPTVALFEESVYGWVFVCVMTTELFPSQEV